MSLILDGSVGVSDVDGSAATPAIRGTDANTGMFFPAADTIAFSEGGVEAMRLDSAGSAIIGGVNSDGGNKLTVTGAAGYAGTGLSMLENSTGDNRRLRIFQDTTAAVYNATFGTGNNLHIWQVGNTERMRLDSAGNLGIGTNNPVARLQVAGTVRSEGAGGEGGQFEMLNVANNATAGIVDVDSSNNTRLLAITNNNLLFGTNATERMRITSAGSVGIGTNSPTQNLHVAGVTRLGDSEYNPGNIELNIQGTGDRFSFIDFHSSGTPAALDLSARIIRGSGANGSFVITNTGTGNIIFENNNAERMRIDSSGSLLVACTGFGSGQVGNFAVGIDRQVSIDGQGGAVYIRGNSGGWATGQYFVGSSGAFLGGFGALGGANALTYYWVGTAFNGTGVSLNYGATSWAALSDEREKNIHGVIENALDKVSQFNGIYYNYKSDEEGAKQRVGFSAQKVKAVFPEAVEEIQREVDNPSEETKRLTLSATDIVPLLVQAIQELKATVDAQAVEIAALKAK